MCIHHIYRAKVVSINTNNEKLEKGKERKALKAAQLDRAIEKELLERLKQVSEGEIYNYPETSYNKALNRASQVYESEGKYLSLDLILCISYLIFVIHV